jgi:hypothetical protein
MSELCQKLHRLFSGLNKLSFPFEASVIPKNGIYILFEKGETAHGTDRIVRIGTDTGVNQLPSRLKQHFLKENKDRSIFRKHIGRVILNKNNDAFLEKWEIDLTSHKAKVKYEGLVDHQKLKDTEKRVSEYIQRNFQFVVFRVDDKSQRLRWESRIISTVSLCDECQPSTKWLGLHSPNPKIREIGLWLIKELYKKPLSEVDYEAMEAAVLGNGG